MSNWWRYSMAVYFGLMIAGVLGAQDSPVAEVMHIGSHGPHPMLDGPQTHHDAAPLLVVPAHPVEDGAAIMALAELAFGP